VEFRITLDREAFKVLASDTRLDILKALDERPMTVSELGRKLDLNKATVFEHLEKLVSAGLVKKQDHEDRMWVYYSLSWKARRILHPERVTIALLFSTAIGALLSGVTVAAEYARQLGTLAQDASQKALPPGAPEAGNDAAPGGASGASAPQTALADRAAEPIQQAAAAADPNLLYIAIALFVMVAVLAAIALWYRKQVKGRDRAEAAAAPKA
jgi:DNA-binding transcriptional ArsR family regulator